MKYKLIAIIAIISTINFSVDTTSFEINSIINSYDSHKNASYMGILSDFRGSYILEDNDFLNFDPTFLTESVAEDDKKAISSKLNALLNTQSLAYEAIQNAILVEKLNDAYQEWVGTKYLWGGDSKKGIDCSAFVRRIFRKVFNYEMPRVSTSQIQKGTRITKEELKTGDILFFRPENRTNHTAIYLGDSLFMHSASSKGVSISSINNSYWKKYFKFGVRVDGIVTRM